MQALQRHNCQFLGALPTGPDNCPIHADVVSNAGIFTSSSLGKTPKISNLVTAELAANLGRQVGDAIVGIENAPVAGTVIDFDAEPYASLQIAVVRAALYGHCSVSEAATVLGQRMNAAKDATLLTKIKGAMDSLKLAEDSITNVQQKGAGRCPRAKGGYGARKMHRFCSPQLASSLA